MATKTAARTAKKSKKASKKLPVCTSKDLRKPKGKRRKCTVPPKKTATSKTTPDYNRASPTGPVAAAPVTMELGPGNGQVPMTPAPTPAPTVTPTGAQPTGPGSPSAPQPPEPVPSPGTEQGRGTTVTTAPGIPVYTGPFGEAQATRLLFRAGFGPKPGEAAALAALGLHGAVSKLVNPGAPALSGPAPEGSFLVDGKLMPSDRWGHMHLRWLDRMVRLNDPLGERMTLILHDWFGVSEAGAERPLVVNHIELLRNSWRGSFRKLLADVTLDPAMLRYLDGIANRKGSPNENYAREFMELYALGAERGAYTELDVREQARALTGWTCDASTTGPPTNFRFDRNRFDEGVKTVFAVTPHVRTGVMSWTDAVNAVVDHPMHPSFVVLKLWSYFMPTAPSAETRAGLEALYRSGNERLQPLVEAILQHPDLYTGPSMVKPPTVYAASLLRARGQGIKTEAWTWWLDSAGQLLGAPPSVAGWNDNGWLSTSSMAARWIMAVETLRVGGATADSYKGKTETPTQALTAALAVWGNPVITVAHREFLLRFASRTWPGRVPGDRYGSNENFLAHRQNILRQLVAAAPDAQVS